MSTERYSISKVGRSYIFVGSDEPLIGETIGFMLERIAKTYPENEALVFVHDGRRWTYAQFYRECGTAAKSFMAMGMQRGDRVAIWATNHPEWVITQTPYNGSLEMRTMTVGPPIPHTEVKIVSPETGRTVPVGVQGELCCRGYQVMRGYYNKSRGDCRDNR